MWETVPSEVKVFVKEVISHSKNKRHRHDAIFRDLKAHKFSCNFDDQLSPKFHKFIILCICWDAPSENTGLKQLPKVSSAFKNRVSKNDLTHQCEKAVSAFFFSHKYSQCKNLERTCYEWTPKHFFTFHY